MEYILYPISDFFENSIWWLRHTIPYKLDLFLNIVPFILILVIFIHTYNKKNIKNDTFLITSIFISIISLIWYYFDDVVLKWFYIIYGCPNWCRIENAIFAAIIWVFWIICFLIYITLLFIRNNSNRRGYIESEKRGNKLSQFISLISRILFWYYLYLIFLWIYKASEYTNFIGFMIGIVQWTIFAPLPFILLASFPIIVKKWLKWGVILLFFSILVIKKYYLYGYSIFSFNYTAIESVFSFILMVYIMLCGSYLLQEKLNH